jgi:membrane protein YqaA with SNARE-associated domain
LLLALADSAGIPIVGGVDLVLITIAVHNRTAAYPSALGAILGSLIGSSILFAIARKGGQVFLEKQIQHGFGKRLHRWFERYGLVTVFIPAVCFIPMPLKIPVFCAGALEVRWSTFLTILTAARVIRYFALAFVAREYGNTTLAFLKAHAAGAAVIACSLAVAALIVLRLSQRMRLLKQ